MVIDTRMKHVPSFFFQHTKRSENASTTHLLEDTNVHQTVIQGRTWGKREAWSRPSDCSAPKKA